jgi:hypothetical protein
MPFKAWKRLLPQYLSAMVRIVVGVESSVGVKVRLPFVAGSKGVGQPELRLQRPAIGAQIQDFVWTILASECSGSEAETNSGRRLAKVLKIGVELMALTFFGGV